MQKKEPKCLKNNVEVSCVVYKINCETVILTFILTKPCTYILLLNCIMLYKSVFRYKFL